MDFPLCGSVLVHVRPAALRVGNWLSAVQGKTLISSPVGLELRNARNQAVLAMLVGCGLHRAEVVTVRIADLQFREDQWVLADLVGKGGHVKTGRGPY